MEQNDYYNMQKILERMEIDLFKNYKRAMMKDIDKPAKQWRELQILNLQQYKKENAKIIKYYKKLVHKEIRKTIPQAFREGIREGFKQILDDASNMHIGKMKSLKDMYTSGKIGIVREEERTEQYFLDKINYSRMGALMNSVMNDYDKALYAAQRQANDIYRQNIFKSEVLFNSGTLSLKQAVDRASKSFIDKGLNSITYSDGKQIDICAYSDMVLRTNGHRAKLQGEATQAGEFGIVTAYVSAHGSTCEKCAPFEGIFCLDDVNNSLTSAQEAKYSDLVRLSEMYAYGWGHPNCRHSLIYMEPDGETNNKPNYELDDEKSKKKIDRYNREQEQRSLERDIRKAKREAVGTLDDKSRKEAQERVKDAQAKMREFLKENTDLVRRYDRENTELTKGY